MALIFVDFEENDDAEQQHRDVLRNFHVRSKYRDVILPMTVLRRLDAVLENGKQTVVNQEVTLDGTGRAEQDVTRGEQRAKPTLLPAERIGRSSSAQDERTGVDQPLAGCGRTR